MADLLLRGLLSEIRSSRWFTIIADEATDISSGEQMCIAIRWVDNNYEIHEDPIGLVQVPKTDAETLTSAIRDVLIRCVLQISLCRGQAYDGAANMAGHLNGVAAHIKAEQPAALFVHCLAYNLNLCLQDVSRISTQVNEALDLVNELVKFVKLSPKRHHLFETIKLQISPETNNLRPLCPTRWTVRTGAIDSVITNYSTLCKLLDEIHESSRDEYSAKAAGLLTQLEKFSTFFGLKLSFMVFSATEQLSRTLKGKDTTIQEAQSVAFLTIAHLRRQRTDGVFPKFYDHVLREAEELNNEPVLPRKRKKTRRTNDGVQCYQHDIPKDYYRQKYFEVFDIVSNEISRHFDQRDFTVVGECEKLLINVANNLDFTISKSVQTTYKEDIQMDRLSVHLKIIQPSTKNNTKCG